jgi:hypothetical protein
MRRQSHNHGVEDWLGAYAIDDLKKESNTMFEFDPTAISSAWPAAQYDAVIEKTEEGASKKGDSMLTVTYRVYHPDGREQTIKDYFVAPGEGKGNLFRLRQLCNAVGPDAAEAVRTGKLDHKKQLRGRSFLLGLKVEESNDFGDQNRADTYSPAMKRAVAVGAEDDDSVPF